MASTPPLKNRKGRKTQSDIPKAGVSEEEVVDTSGSQGRGLLLDYYMRQEGSFMFHWATDIGAVLCKHRLYPVPFDLRFWTTLFGYTDDGWLESWVKLILLLSVDYY